MDYERRMQRVMPRVNTYVNLYIVKLQFEYNSDTTLLSILNFTVF